MKASFSNGADRPVEPGHVSIKRFGQRQPRFALGPRRHTGKLNCFGPGVIGGIFGSVPTDRTYVAVDSEGFPAGLKRINLIARRIPFSGGTVRTKPTVTGRGRKTETERFDRGRSLRGFSSVNENQINTGLLDPDDLRALRCSGNSPGPQSSMEFPNRH